MTPFIASYFRSACLSVAPVAVALVATLAACSDESTHVAPTQPSFTFGTELAPSVEFSPERLFFGQHAVNFPNTSWQSVRIDNVGTADLVISDVSIAGPQYAEFSVNRASSDPCPIDAPLEPGKYCTVLVKFEPTAVGHRLGSLIVTSNAGSPTMFLTGEGVTGTDVAARMTASTTGKLITYTLVVTNLGPGEATGVRFGNGLPAGTTFVSAAAPSDADCFMPTPGSTTGLVTCNIPSMASGSSRTFEIGVKIVGGPKSPITYTVGIDSNTLDPVVENNYATVTTGGARR